MMNSGCGLPEDVLYDILLWLPVASLLRFKSVCKDWFDLIGGSSFITEHLNRSKNTENALIVHAGEADERYRTLFMLIHGREYQKCSKLEHMQVLLTPSDSYDYRLIGSWDGIVCVRTTDYGNLALCNPAMKQIKYLPKPAFPFSSGEEESEIDGFVVMGFGFDFKANDYKVIRVLFYDYEPRSSNHKKIVEVYSMKANSWRTLHMKGASLPFIHLEQYPQATNKDGTCFWIGMGFDLAYKLISFDLSNEVFGMMSLPDVDFPEGANGLDILNDKLVYMKGAGSDDCTSFYEKGGQSYCACTSQHGYKSFEIWMLQEFGVDGSWSKIYRIGPIFQKSYFLDDDIYCCPIRLSKNGKFVVVLDGHNTGCQLGKLRSYNLRI